MADIQSRIASFAPKNDELLGVLRQTDYAEAALRQQQLYVRDLENELNQVVKNIQQYESKTKIEKAEFEKYRDSNIKRFAYKLGGSKGKDKFHSRTEKEEKEYYEALEKERTAKDRKQTLDGALTDGRGARDHYQRDNDTHQRAQKELDDLYNMVFNGPTPGFPAEDQTEWQFSQAREHFNTVEQKYRAIHQAVDIFNEARKHIAMAARHMADARSASQMDMFGGGMMADMAERSALSRAESEASQVKALVDQARRTYPEGVRDIGQFEVAQGNLLGDVLFDSVFSDFKFHEKIKASQAQIAQAQQNIEGQFNGLQQNLANQRQALDAEQASLTAARRQLQDMRTQIFSQVGGQAPPPYTNYQ